MSHDELAGFSEEELKTKCLEPMAKVFQISPEDAEEIYCRIMKEPPFPLPQFSNALTKKTMKPTRKGWYWYHTSSETEPAVVLIDTFYDRELFMYTVGSDEN